jgi:spore germination cell wall hydrolase CwlJ-like protein
MIATALMCLALNIHFEAGNQPLRGKEAVAYVTLNRVASSGKDVCAVVAKPYQFSWVGVKMPRKRLKSGNYTLKIDKKALPRGKSWQKTLKLARFLLENTRKPPPITHFHATYVHPRWAKKLIFVEKIGDHLFYFERKEHEKRRNIQKSSRESGQKHQFVGRFVQVFR